MKDGTTEADGCCGHIEARSSPIHGTGVYAVAPIACGTQVLEYLGRRVLWASFRDRRQPHTELFHVSPTHVIDPSLDGNEARYINHSCDPNCEARQEEDRIFIYALRDLRPGEEIYYDYGLVLGRRFTRADVFLHRCRCGSSRCRGTMLAVPPHRRTEVLRWVRAS